MRLALGFNPVFPVKEMTKLAVKAEGKGYESISFLPSAIATASRMKAEMVIRIQKSRTGTWNVKNQRAYAAGRVRIAVRPSAFIGAALF
jgi:hypothetical protein